jgi:hypothetical protein
VRTVFQNTFEAAPPASDVLQYMNMPYKQDAISSSSSSINDQEKDAQEDGETWVQLPLDGLEDELNSLEETASGGESSITSPISSSEEEEEEEHDIDIGDKILQIFSSVFGHCVAGNQEAHESRNALSSIIHPSSNNNNKTNGIAAKNNKMVMEKNDVPFYLSVLRPLEEGLDRLVHELNMDDPSRV